MNRKNLEFGKYISEKRKALGISQQRLATLLKVHPTYLSKIEREGFVPRPRLVRHLALCLQADPAELIELSGVEPTSYQFSWPDNSKVIGLTRDETIFIQNFRTLSADGKRFLENSLKYVLAGENKAFHTDETKMSSSKSEIEKYDDQSSSKKNQYKEIPKLESLPTTKESPGKLSQLFQSAKKEYSSGNKDLAIASFNKILISHPGEKTVREISAYLLRKDSAEVANEFINKISLKEIESKFLKSKIISKLKSPSDGLQYLETEAKADPSNLEVYRIHMADLLLKMGETEKSKQLLNAVNHLEVKTPSENVMGTMLGISLGELKTAEKYAEQASRIKDSEKNGMTLLCYIYLAQANGDELAKAASTFKDKYSTDPVAHLFDAIALHLQSRADDSLLSFERAIALNLDYSPIVDTLVEFYLTDGVSPNRLIPLLEKFEKNGSDKFFIAYSNVLKKSDRLDKAHDILQMAKTKFPKSQRLAYELAVDFYIKDRLPEAEDELKVFETNSEASPSSLLLLSKIRKDRGNFIGAQFSAEKAINNAPEWLAPVISLAEIYASQGQDAKALSLLEEQKKKHSEKTSQHQIIDAEATIYSDRKLFEQAIPILEKLVSEYPQNSSYKSRLGYAYVRSGNYDGGISQFSKILEINPNLFYASNNLAYSYNMAENYTKALEILEDVKNRTDLTRNDLGLVYSNMSHALVKLGKTEDAEVTALKAIDLAPDWAEAHFNLGLCLLKKGNTSDAKEEFQKAVSLDKEGILLPIVQKYLKKAFIIEQNN